RVGCSHEKAQLVTNFGGTASQGGTIVGLGVWLGISAPSIASRRERNDGLDVVQRPTERGGRLLRPDQRLGRCPDTLFSFLIAASTVRRGQGSKKHPGLIAHPCDDSQDLFALPGKPFDVTRKILKAVVAHRKPEILRGDVLELVRFVDDGVTAGRD